MRFIERLLGFCALALVIGLIGYGCSRATEEAGNPSDPASKTVIAATPAGMQTVTLHVAGMT